MRCFKDIFEKWEQENRNFDYSKTLSDKDDNYVSNEIFQIKNLQNLCR